MSDYSIRVTKDGPQRKMPDGSYKPTSWAIADAVFTMNIPLAQALIEQEEQNEKAPQR
ncbi:hypothetical protein [Arenimonas sp.]|uniref:hypothetical protein n=1 Tax=Arenimonas sp. TaxID=1872635 RepID=UPI0039E53280